MIKGTNAMKWGISFSFSKSLKSVWRPGEEQGLDSSKQQERITIKNSKVFRAR